ncbi:MAG: hypothetical protein LBD87_02850, partial [Prevotellaceae bacterium]|nr:hypothetical protein [Prevotellaceae bacterium]
RYHAQLCKPPWRIPTLVDAKNLALAFGCPEYANSEVCVKKFMNQWGGELMGVQLSTEIYGHREYAGYALLNKTNRHNEYINSVYYASFLYSNDYASYAGNGLYWWYQAGGNADILH